MTNFDEINIGANSKLANIKICKDLYPVMKDINEKLYKPMKIDIGTCFLYDECKKTKKGNEIKKVMNLNFGWQKAKSNISKKTNCAYAITGYERNLAIIDVDTHDNGAENWEKICEREGFKDKESENFISTFMIKTQSGGCHYYFRYPEELKGIGGRAHHLVYENFRYTGIDTRLENNCGITEPTIFTSITGKQKHYIRHYEHINFNRDKIADFPKSLLKYFPKLNKENKILESEEKMDIREKRPRNWENKENICGVRQKCGIKEGREYKRMLTNLNPERFDSYDDWLYIGFICKDLGESYDFWDSLSQKSEKYNPDDYMKNKDKYENFEQDVQRGINGIIKLHLENEGAQIYTGEFFNPSDFVNYGKRLNKAFSPDYPKKCYLIRKLISKKLNKYFAFLMVSVKLMYIYKSEVYRDSLKGLEKYSIWKECDERTIKQLLRDTVPLTLEVAGEIYTQKIPLHDIFIKSPKARQVKNYLFNAGLTEKEQIKRGLLDNFSGFNIDENDSRQFVNDMERDEYERQKNIYLKHIMKIWCKNNEDKFNYVMDWISYIMQNPGKKTNVCLALVGEQGSGKGIIIDQWQRIIGRNCATVNNFENILKFNRILMDKCLVHLEECKINTKRLTNIFKSLVTQTKTTYEEKYISVSEQKNINNFVISTNHENFIYYGTGNERRMMVLNTSSKYSEISKKSEDYFNRLSGVNDNVVAHILYERDISKFNPYALHFNTTEKYEQKLKTLGRVDKYLYDCLTNEMLLTTLDCEGEIEIVKKENVIPTDEFYGSFRNYLKDLGDSRQINKIALKQKITKMFECDVKRRKIEGKRKTVFILPGIDVMKFKFIKFHKLGKKIFHIEEDDEKIEKIKIVDDEILSLEEN